MSGRLKVLVTGAGGLIGSAIVAELSKHFDIIAHVGRGRNGYRGNNAFAILSYDFSKDAEEFVNLVLRRWGPPWAVVLSHGIYEEGGVEDVSTENLLRVLRINLISNLVIASRLGAVMNEGVIVMLTDVVARRRPWLYRSLRPSLAYLVSKAGLDYAVAWLAKELGPGVRVVGIAPGWVRSNRMKETHMREASEAPLGRPVEPEEVARTVAWVIREARHLTGIVIELSGGL